MEAASSPGDLQELRQHLCTETEPGKLDESLQKLSSLPKLCDALAEMDFKQILKLLREEQLLVPFAKDLAAIWSERSEFGSQPEPEPRDFAFALSLMTLRPRNRPEGKARESASREHRQDGTEVFQVSGSSEHSSRSPSPSPSPSPGLGASLSPHTSLDPRVTRSPRQEPRASKRPRVSLGDPQLAAAQNPVPVAKPRGRAEEPWRLQAAKPISSESDAGGKTPGRWMEEEGPPADSVEACLDSDSSPPSPALLRLRLRLRLTRCKKEGKSTWKAEALSPGAKVPRGRSESCQDPQDNGAAGPPLPQEASSPQARFPLGGQEHTSFHTGQEDPPWACRKNLKTLVYSGAAPALLPQNSQQGRLADSLDCPWKTHCQDPVEETEPRQQEEDKEDEEEEVQEEMEDEEEEEESSSPQTHTGKPTDTQTESATILQLQESPELRLQALRARLRDAQAKKPQGRQTKMIAFPAPATSPGQQAESGPGGAASSEMSSLQEASAHGLPPPRAPCLSSRGSNKTQPKKRPAAPLMAKAIRDYKKRLSRR